jgi:DNA-binding beta-propeller fold protein YncE
VFELNVFVVLAGKLIAVDLDHDDDDNEYRSYVVGNPGAAGFETQQVGIKLNVTGAFFQPEAPDTDPYGIAVDERDGTVYVANAGSNFLQAVRNGRTTTVAFFPAYVVRSVLRALWWC